MIEQEVMDSIYNQYIKPNEERACKILESGRLIDATTTQDRDGIHTLYQVEYAVNKSCMIFYTNGKFKGILEA